MTALSRISSTSKPGPEPTFLQVRSTLTADRFGIPGLLAFCVEELQGLLPLAHALTGSDGGAEGLQAHLYLHLEQLSRASLASTFDAAKDTRTGEPAKLLQA